MLTWNKELWLIDHGAALYFHHTWDNWSELAVRPFLQIKDHVLLPGASELDAVDEEFKSILTPDVIRAIVSLVPDDWIKSEWLEEPDEVRSVYSQFLEMRIAASAIFVEEAKHARE
jgi:hypothetical protein